MLLGILRMLPGLAATLSAMLGAVSLLPRDRTRQHSYFGLMNLGTYLWSLSYFLGLGATGWFAALDAQTVGWALFGVGQVGVALSTTMWLVFALDIVGVATWTNGRRLLLLCTPGLLLLSAMLTNPVHHLFVTTADWSKAANFSYGPIGNMVNVVMSLYIVGGSLAYVRALRDARAESKRKLYGVLSVAAIAPLVGNVVWMTRGLTGVQLPFNPTVVLFTLMNLLLGIAVFRVGLLDIVPIAEGKAFRSMTDAAVVLGVDGRIAATNESFCRIFATAGIGETFAEVAPGLSVHKEVHGSRSEGPVSFPFDLGECSYQVQLTTMTAGSGKSLGELIVMTDVTEERETRQRIMDLNRSLERSVMELEEATHLKDRFIADMSHELRTPLQSIIGFAGAMERGLPGDLNPVQLEHVSVILDAARHLAALIESLLDLSRIESGVMVASARKFDVNDVARRVMETMRPLAGRKNIALKVQLCEETVCTVHSDETKCRQILLNLLGNAIKFTETGHVELAVGYGGDHVEFTVSDTGPGISPEDLPRVFDAFYQGATSNSAALGTGLGLYVSKTLAGLLGGSINVESNLGHGTTFRVWLPAELPAEEPSFATSM